MLNDIDQIIYEIRRTRTSRLTITYLGGLIKLAGFGEMKPITARRLFRKMIALGLMTRESHRSLLGRHRYVSAYRDDAQSLEQLTLVDRSGRIVSS